MPTNALENPLVLPILGLLVEAPRHPYAIFTELRSRYGYLRVRNATVYTLLNRLTEAGWIQPGHDSLLSTTAEGSAALAEKVTGQIRGSRPADRTTFATALAYIGILPADQACELLGERREIIRDETERLSRVIEEAEVPELHMIEAAYVLGSLRHDAAWLEDTVERIRTGRLVWPVAD